MSLADVHICGKNAGPVSRLGEQSPSSLRRRRLGVPPASSFLGERSSSAAPHGIACAGAFFLLDRGAVSIAGATTLEACRALLSDHLSYGPAGGSLRSRQTAPAGSSSIPTSASHNGVTGRIAVCSPTTLHFTLGHRDDTNLHLSHTPETTAPRRDIGILLDSNRERPLALNTLFNDLSKGYTAS
ncbi:unnamed protein product [Pleuronectes platessa]|uniref:Uncharacterized protein n=1 Tax=Pleuronectes platessa TaxID=8262 RepID=A0A9N7V3N6_PLEPL|nr:unnamed protein product [Pleuronectes platessa]